MPKTLPPSSTSVPTEKQWLAAVEAGDSPQLRAWLKAGLEPPMLAWKAAAQSTWRPASRKSFQALASGKFPVPMEWLEHATAGQFDWGRSTFARLVPKALTSDQWLEWLGVAWMRQVHFPMRYRVSRAWSTSALLGWLDWSVEKKWVAPEAAALWCAKQSLGMLTEQRLKPLAEPALPEAGPLLKALAEHIEKHGGFSTPEMSEAQKRLFRAVFDRPIDTARLVKEPPGVGHLPREPGPPLWVSRAVDWWGAMPAEGVDNHHPASHAIAAYPECAREVLLNPGFDAVRELLVRSCVLALRSMAEDELALLLPAVLSGPNGKHVVQDWLKCYRDHDTLFPVGAMGIMLREARRQDWFEPGDGVLLQKKLLFRGVVEASSSKGEQSPKPWWDLIDILGVDPVLAEPVWVDLLSRAWVQNEAPALEAVRQGVEDWERVTGRRLALPEPVASALPAFRAWHRERALSATWAEPSSTSKPRF